VLTGPGQTLDILQPEGSGTSGGDESQKYSVMNRIYGTATQYAGNISSITGNIGIALNVDPSTGAITGFDQSPLDMPGAHYVVPDQFYNPYLTAQNVSPAGASVPGQLPGIYIGTNSDGTDKRFAQGEFTVTNTGIDASEGSILANVVQDHSMLSNGKIVSTPTGDKWVVADNKNMVITEQLQNGTWVKMAGLSSISGDVDTWDLKNNVLEKSESMNNFEDAWHHSWFSAGMGDAIDVVDKILAIRLVGGTGMDWMASDSTGAPQAGEIKQYFEVKSGDVNVDSRALGNAVSSNNGPMLLNLTQDKSGYGFGFDLMTAMNAEQHDVGGELQTTQGTTNLGTAYTANTDASQLINIGNGLRAGGTIVFNPFQTFGINIDPDNTIVKHEDTMTVAKPADQGGAAGLAVLQDVNLVYQPTANAEGWELDSKDSTTKGYSLTWAKANENEESTSVAVANILGFETYDIASSTATVSNDNSAIALDGSLLLPTITVTAKKEDKPSLLEQGDVIWGFGTDKGQAPPEWEIQSGSEQMTTTTVGKDLNLSRGQFQSELNLDPSGLNMQSFGTLLLTAKGAIHTAGEGGFVTPGGGSISQGTTIEYDPDAANGFKTIEKPYTLSEILAGGRATQTFFPDTEMRAAPSTWDQITDAILHPINWISGEWELDTVENQNREKFTEATGIYTEPTKLAMAYRYIMVSSMLLGGNPLGETSLFGSGSSLMTNGFKSIGGLYGLTGAKAIWTGVGTTMGVAGASTTGINLYEGNSLGRSLAYGAFATAAVPSLYLLAGGAGALGGSNLSLAERFVQNGLGVSSDTAGYTYALFGTRLVASETLTLGVPNAFSLYNNHGLLPWQTQATLLTAGFSYPLAKLFSTSLVPTENEVLGAGYRVLQNAVSQGLTWGEINVGVSAAEKAYEGKDVSAANLWTDYQNGFWNGLLFGSVAGVAGEIAGSNLSTVSKYALAGGIGSLGNVAAGYLHSTQEHPYTWKQAEEDSLVGAAMGALGLTSLKNVEFLQGLSLGNKAAVYATSAIVGAGSRILDEDIFHSDEKNAYTMDRAISDATVGAGMGLLGMKFLSGLKDSGIEQTAEQRFASKMLADNLLDTSVKGALKWITVSPAFTVGNALWNGHLGDINISKGDAFDLVESAINGPLSGRWMNVIFNASQVQGVTPSEGSVRQILQNLQKGPLESALGQHAWSNIIYMPGFMTLTNKATASVDAVLPAPVMGEMTKQFLSFGAMTALPAYGTRGIKELTTGYESLNEGKIESAEKSFQNAVDLDPNNMQARVGLASVQDALGRTTPDATLIFEESAACVSAAFPNNVEKLRP